MKGFVNFLKYSSLHVAAISVLHMMAFFYLPLGNSKVHWPTVLQLFISTWIIYILDRLLDNLKSPNPSLRHEYFNRNQYNYSILIVGLLIIDVVLCFFQKTEILIFGLILSFFIGIYLYLLTKKDWFAPYKEYVMPLFFVSAVAVPPLIIASSINLSAWILLFMYLLIIYQNLFAISYFENLNNEKNTNITKNISLQKLRKWVNYFSSFNIFIFGFFFLNLSTYPDKLAAIIVSISIMYALSLVFEKKIKTIYREILDSLLFLFLIIFLF